MKIEKPKNRTNCLSRVKIWYIDKYIKTWKVLDIACWYWWYSNYLINKWFNVVWVDQQKREEFDFQFYQIDLEKWIWIFEDNSFENIIAFDIVEHIKNEDLILREISRICKSTLLLSVPNKDDTILQKYYLTTVARIDDTHIRYYLWPDLWKKLEDLWFEIIIVRKEWQISPWFICEFFPNFMKNIIWFLFHWLYKLKILYNYDIAGDIFIVAKKK